jgi:hypothetical protein
MNQYAVANTVYGFGSCVCQSWKCKTGGFLREGRRYNRAKKAQGGTGANQYSQRDQNEPSAKTAIRLAEEHGVSPATIKRDGKVGFGIIPQICGITFLRPKPGRCLKVVPSQLLRRAVKQPSLPALPSRPFLLRRYAAKLSRMPQVERSPPGTGRMPGSGYWTSKPR